MPSTHIMLFTFSVDNSVHNLLNPLKNKPLHPLASDLPATQIISRDASV